MNRPELDIGAELSQLRDFTSGFPPEMKGERACRFRTVGLRSRAGGKGGAVAGRAYTGGRAFDGFL